MNTVAKYFDIYDILGGIELAAIMRGKNSFFLTFLYLQSGCQHKHIMLKVFSHSSLDLKNVKVTLYCATKGEGSND